MPEQGHSPPQPRRCQGSRQGRRSSPGPLGCCADTQLPGPCSPQNRKNLLSSLPRRVERCRSSVSRSLPDALWFSQNLLSEGYPQSPGVWVPAVQASVCTSPSAPRPPPRNMLVFCHPPVCAHDPRGASRGSECLPGEVQDAESTPRHTVLGAQVFAAPLHSLGCRSAALWVRPPPSCFTAPACLLRLLPWGPSPACSCPG